MNSGLSKLKDKLPSDEADIQFCFGHCYKTYFPIEFDSELI